jgi:tetratricopeptide (TPR) repeat protein
MTTDVYQPCPCGIDKKIKFCCGAEVIADLGKIEEALQGEQRLGALDLCNKLLAAKPDRPCVRMYKAMVQLGMREMNGARQSIEEILAQSPRNPAGLAMSATMDCFDGHVEDGIEKLQAALEEQQGKLVNAVYEALGVVGRSLATAGEAVAAHAHLLLQAGASRGQDRNATYALLELEGSGQIPLAARGALTLSDLPAETSLPPDDVVEFGAALRLTEQGCWLAAAKRFEELAERNPQEPVLWRNIGILRARILNNGVAMEALKRYASFPAVPREMAIEAMALALYFSDPDEIDLVDDLTAAFALPDASALQEHLLSSKRVQSVPFDPAMFQEVNEPPPLAAFLVLDREIPATSTGLSRDNIPKIVGELMLFGKQTDRDARAEFTTIKSSDYEAKLKSLREATGPLIGDKVSEEVTGKMPAASVALSANWRFPDDASLEVRQKMVAEHRTLALLSVWPNLPMGILGGKSPRVAVSSPEGQLIVAAHILTMELAEDDDNADYNKLRRSLGLATLEPIDPTGIRVAALSPAQQTRLMLDKVSDDDLIMVFRGAVMLGAPRLIRRTATEIVSRPSLDSRQDMSKAEVFDILSRRAASADEALEFNHKAQAAAREKGQSPAQYLLGEFSLRLRRGEGTDAERILQTLQTRHIREPGIAQALYSVLAQLGLVELDPTTGLPMPARRAGAPAAAPSGSGLWTPDQQLPASAEAGGSPSKLWIPGMD